MTMIRICIICLCYHGLNKVNKNSHFIEFDQYHYFIVFVLYQNMGNLLKNVRYPSFNWGWNSGIDRINCLLFETFMSLLPREDQLLAF